ncbi:hypothetical protein [Kangiella koreensis]|uniref:Lipoprotein n=1 Tax=Kangiella koreensis (strain DSM 16069 / JCM 12317 / KCTC 12182 / SW-125) TaxID=523791 RepID=C7R9Y6_KANKD|nr:hypothetical protein [Kangiella koreensis]ACV28005.1 hypothetical protein Kkor_2597 [Kangiella koreensis DSM 16069]
MLTKLSFLSVIFFVSSCATQAPVASKGNLDPEEKVASEETKEPRIICKRTHTVGTNFKKKQCWTVEDYEDLQRRSREAVERAQGSEMTAPQGR